MYIYIETQNQNSIYHNDGEAIYIFYFVPLKIKFSYNPS